MTCQPFRIDQREEPGRIHPLGLVFRRKQPAGKQPGRQLFLRRGFQHAVGRAIGHQHLPVVPGKGSSVHSSVFFRRDMDSVAIGTSARSPLTKSARTPGERSK